MNFTLLTLLMSLRYSATLDLNQGPATICLQGAGILGEVPVYHRATAVIVAFLAVWGGIVDIASAQGSRPSATACDSYARNYASNASRQGQVLRGGAVGSLVGLGLGSITGAAGAGAAIGAGIGMIGGGIGRSATADRMYNAAYQDCISGRIR
jgi:hypothetical protein